MKSALQIGTLLLAAVAAGPLMATDAFTAEAPVKTPATQPVAAVVVVHISDFNFSPKSVSISVGTTVTWINNDDVPHTATSKGDHACLIPRPWIPTTSIRSRSRRRGLTNITARCIRT